MDIKDTLKKKRGTSVGMVYGVFDGLHEGHKHFLEEAKKFCDKLVVVVAHPLIVQKLKHHVPYHSSEARIAALKAFDPKIEAVIGDSSIGTWSALKHYRPDIVLLGYDQVRLGAELEKLGVHTEIITPHLPDTYKSSLLNDYSPLP